MKTFNVDEIFVKLNIAIENNQKKYDDYQQLVLKLKEMGFDYKVVFGDLMVIFDNFKKDVETKPFVDVDDFISRTSLFMSAVKKHYLESRDGHTQNELYKLGIDTSNFDLLDLDFILDVLSEFLVIDEDTISWWFFDDDYSFKGENIKVIYIGKGEIAYDVIDAKDLLDLYYLNNDEVC